MVLKKPLIKKVVLVCGLIVLPALAGIDQRLSLVTFKLSRKSNLFQFLYAGLVELGAIQSVSANVFR